MTVIGDKEKEDGKTYGTITRRAERIAAQQLNDNLTAYLLYIHFALHQNNYRFAFSPAALSKALGISKDRCRVAFNKLVERGFLVEKAPGSNEYTFYEFPPQKEGIEHEEVADADDMEIASEVSPSTPISGQAPISPSMPISAPVPTGIPVTDDRYMPPEEEGYPDVSGEGIPVEGDRNITTDTTINTTTDSTENMANSELSKSRKRTPAFDRCGFDRIVYDENGEPDEEHIYSFWPVPDEVKRRYPYDSADDDWDMPF